MGRAQILARTTCQPVQEKRRQQNSRQALHGGPPALTQGSRISRFHDPLTPLDPGSLPLFLLRPTAFLDLGLLASFSLLNCSLARLLGSRFLRAFSYSRGFPL